MDAPVLLFDGVCSLCNAAVDFVVRHERAPTLKFAALQSQVATRLLTERLGAEQAELLCKGAAGSPDTLVLVDGEQVLVRSTAVLRVARHLRWPWRALRIGWLVPRPLRDALYRFIARNRYAWFGEKETCRIPTPEERARFLG